MQTSMVKARELKLGAMTSLKLSFSPARVPLNTLVELTETIIGCVSKGQPTQDFISKGSKVFNALRTILKDETRDINDRLEAAKAIRKLSDFAFSEKENAFAVLDILACDKTPVPGTSDEIKVTKARGLDDTIDLAEELLRKARLSS